MRASLIIEASRSNRDKYRVEVTVGVLALGWFLKWLEIPHRVLRMGRIDFELP